MPKIRLEGWSIFNNIVTQPGFPPTPCILDMAAASKPPKAPETVAMDANIAVRKPNSDRLYQLKVLVCIIIPLLLRLHTS